VTRKRNHRKKIVLGCQTDNTSLSGVKKKAVVCVSRLNANVRVEWGKICTDFDKNDEIYTARKIIDNAGHRMPKRQGTNKRRATVEDILKEVFDPERSLPTFYATDLSRLPPTDVKYCDMSAILAELQSLCSEVRTMRHLNDEVISC